MKIQDFINGEITRLASTGVSARQAASELGICYPTFLKKAKMIGVSFGRMGTSHPGRKITEGDLEVIKQMHLDAVPLQDIGKKFGVTRERIRQIVKVAGLVPSRLRQADFAATVVGTMQRKNLTISEAAAMFDTARHNIFSYCRKAGYRPQSMTYEERRVLDHLVEEVKSGASFRGAACGDRNLEKKLARYAKKTGVRAKGRSRHDDFSTRRVLMEQWRKDGKSWRECAVLLSEHDDRLISAGGVYQWCTRHMPHLLQDEACAA